MCYKAVGESGELGDSIVEVFMGRRGEGSKMKNASPGDGLTSEIQIQPGTVVHSSAPHVEMKGASASEIFRKFGCRSHLNSAR